MPPIRWRSHESLLSIPGDIAVKLALPEFRTCFGHGCICATLMSMPEAAMNENGDSVTCEDQIRRAWEVLAVKSEAQAHSMGGPTHRNLRHGITSANARHDLAPPLAIENVGHAWNPCLFCLKTSSVPRRVG